MRSQFDQDYNNLNNTIISNSSSLSTTTTMTTNNSTNSNNNDQHQDQHHQQQQQQQQTSSTFSSTNNPINWSKIQALKFKKSELEKILNEKNLLLQQIQKQEAQIINGNLDNCIDNSNNNNVILRRKVGTSFKLPKLLSNEDSEIENFLLDKKAQQEICNNSFKLSNDPNISKSIRRSHKADYEMAQQKLITINKNLNILKKCQSTNLSTQIKSNSLSGSITCLNSLTLKSSCQQEQQQINDNYNNALTINCNSNNFKLNNNNIKNSTERRNSIKSTTALTINTSNFDKILKSHRSDYDLNNLYNQKTNNLITPSQFINNHELESNNSNNNNFVQQYHKIIDDFENYNNQHYHNNHNYFNNTLSPDNINYYNNTNNNNIKYCKNRPILNLSTSPFNTSVGGDTNILQSDKYYFSPTQLQYDNNSSGGGFIKSSRNIRQATPTDSLATNCNQQDQSQNNQLNSNIKDKYIINDHKIPYDYDNNNLISTYQSNVSDNNSSDEQQLQSTGLGGYWRLLPSSNDQVWCAFENSYDNTNSQHQKAKKLDNPTQQLPSKSSSLSNFDIISIKDDSIDKISISSINSDTSKSKLKEKQWLETSLDGPIIRVKSEIPSHQQHTFNHQSKEQNSTSSVYGHQSNLLTNYHHNHNTNNSVNQLSPITVTQHRHNSYRENSKLLSKTIKLDDVSSYLSHSTSVLNSESINGDDTDINNHNDKEYINYIKDRQLLQQQLHQQNLIITASPLSSNSPRTIENQYQNNNNYIKTNHINGLQIQKPSSYSLRNSYARSLNSQQLSPLQYYHYHNHYNQNSPTPELPLLSSSSSSSSQNLINLTVDNNINNNNNSKLSPIDITTSSSSIINLPTTSSCTNNNNNNMSVIGKLSPDIRIESPKNMTIVQQATFMPYKEVSKPFEMSDFYKYSTKFRQKDINIGGSINNGTNLINSSKLPMPLPTTNINPGQILK